MLRFALFLTLPLVSFAATIEAAFSPGNAETRVVSVIDGAKKSIRLAAYSFTSKPIAKALVEAKRRGVDVRALLDKSQRSERYTGATFLVNEGISVRINSRYAIMHNKFLVIDDEIVETGSFNYTSAAAHKNAENVLIVRDDKTLAASYTEMWAKLWAESEAYERK